MINELELQKRKEVFERLRHTNKMQELKLERENIERDIEKIEKCIEYKKVPQ